MDHFFKYLTDLRFWQILMKMFCFRESFRDKIFKTGSFPQKSERHFSFQPKSLFLRHFDSGKILHKDLCD
jgi:hypothetical protein